ncbi:hypothetical protein [uncultured Megasphaera sp.]|uniref:hypothetical protein n=1 Tax=Megasphaera massiliensis TaxID=1232428 RepID=UPI00266D2909|nr:hypothetical protein [uncultured Megasphaera sp.]
MTYLKRTCFIGLLGIGIALSLVFIIPTPVHAYYTDTLSISYGGTRDGYEYYSANVVDDNGIVYKFEYRGMPHTDDLTYRLQGNHTWQYFHIDPPYSHLENLASEGWKGVRARYLERSI